MENLIALLGGFSVAVTPFHIGLMIVGVLLGILVGVLPGLGAPNGVSLLLPLTFSMDPVAAIILLTSMYWGALFGGSTTSILFNIPGEPSSVATTFDGYPMAQQGRATEALSLAFLSAGFGALVGVIVITLLSGFVQKFALKFSSPEYFAVYFLAFASFVGLGGAPILKTIVSIGIGFALAAVGMDSVSGSLRLTFEIDQLIAGVSFLVVVIGLFGIGELILTIEEGLQLKGIHAKVSPRDVWRTLLSMPRHWATLIRSALVGVWMGITPGGPTAASFMSYGLAKRFSAYRDNFGKGEPDGVIAPETADHSAGTAAMLPMLALGIPGSATAAVMLGGLMIWGLNPGPMLFVERPDFVWGLIASMYLGNVLAVVLVLATVPLFASILRYHRPRDRGGLLHRCLYCRLAPLRPLAGAGFWFPRLRLQEARLPHSAAGVGHGHWRQGGGCLPPVADHVPGINDDLLVERAGDDADDAGVRAAALAGCREDGREARGGLIALRRGSTPLVRASRRRFYKRIGRATSRRCRANHRRERWSG
jgi:putative tricarboxylic transport membrane protein